MAAFSQTTFSNAFSSMKMFEFRLQFHWSLFLRVKLTIFQHRFRSWLSADQATRHYLNQWWLVHWRKYASLGLNELTQMNVDFDAPTCVGCWVQNLGFLLLTWINFNGWAISSHTLLGMWLLTHTEITVNSSSPSAAYTRQLTGSTLIQVMVCHLFGARSLHEPMLVYCQLDSQEPI